MAKRDLGWPLFWLSVGAGAMLAMLSVPEWAIQVCAILAIGSFVITAILLGWTKAPVWIGTFPRTILVLGFILGMVGWCAHKVRQHFSAIPRVLISTYKVTGGGSRPPNVEVHFRSTSDTPTHVTAYGSIGAGDCTDDRALNNQNGELAYEGAKNLSRTQKGIELTIPPRAEMHFNLPDTKATQEKTAQLIAGSACLYFAGFLSYQIDGVSHETPYCGFSDSGHELPNCPDHNDPY